jgi:hypothetical protein
MSPAVAILGVILPKLVAGQFAHFAYLTARNVSAGRVLGNLNRRCPQCQTERSPNVEAERIDR